MTAAKTRKRCPWCRKMVEVNDECTVVDDRYTVDRPRFFVPGNAAYQRGAVHLYHPACRTAEQAAVAEAEARSKAEREREIAAIRAAAGL